MTRLWMVRLGKFGEKEAHALETGELITGWIVGDLSGAANREDMLKALEAAYPDEKPGTLQNWAAQLNQLKNVAVAGEARQRGLGKVLVEAALARVRQRGARECFLEVRESNLVARRLYEGLGFASIGRRRRYYSRPVEDALVMRVALAG